MADWIVGERKRAIARERKTTLKSTASPRSSSRNAKLTSIGNKFCMPNLSQLAGHNMNSSKLVNLDNFKGNKIPRICHSRLLGLGWYIHNSLLTS